MQNQPPFTTDVNPYAPPVVDDSVLPSWSGGGTGMLATRGSRLGARILDGIVLLVAMGPGFAIAMAGGGDTVFLGYALAIIGALAVTGYQWYLIATTAQSLGKKWLKIRIVRLDGSDPGFVYGVIARNWAIGLLSSIPYVGSVVGLVNVLFIFGEEQRCLHDHIAGTRVIDVSMSGY